MVHSSSLDLQESLLNYKRCLCVPSQRTSHPASAEGNRRKSPQASARGLDQRAKVMWSRTMASPDRRVVPVLRQAKALVARCSAVKASAQDSSSTILGLG